MKDMVHKSGKTTRLLSALLTAVMILSSGGFEVLAADAGASSDWEAAKEEWKSAEASEEAPEEESDGTQGTDETPEEDSGSALGTGENLKEGSDSNPGTGENPEGESDTIPEAVETPEEDSENFPDTEEKPEEDSGEVSEESIDTEKEELPEEEEITDEVSSNLSGTLTGLVNSVSGSYGNITWSIDGNGQLTVTGTGDFSERKDIIRAPWYSERESIKSAVISVRGMTDASYMFYECSNLTTLDVTNFDTSNVTTMNEMFFRCGNLIDPDLSKFDTSNVTDMRYMFYGCSSLRSLSLTNFNTGKVTNMQSMFSSCDSLTYLDVSSFDTGKVTNMNTMFSGCKSLVSLNLSNIDAAHATDMEDMFSFCYGLSSVYTPYNVSQSVSLPDHGGDIWYGPDGTQITELPKNLNHSVLIIKNKISIPSGSEHEIQLYAPHDQGQELQSLDLLKRFADYDGITGYEIISYTEDPGFAGNVLSGTPTISNGILWYGTNAGAIGDFATITIELRCVGQDNITLIITISLRDMGGDIANGNYQDITWFIDREGKLTVEGAGEFGPPPSLPTLGYGWNRVPWYKYRDHIKTAVVNVTGMKDASYMFYELENLTSVDLSGLDTSAVTSMYCMFYRCVRLTALDLSKFDTSNVTDMFGMFTNVGGVTELDVSHFDTSKVTNMSQMFYGCSKVEYLDLSGFDTSNVTEMYNMFSNCSNMTALDLSHFDTSNVTNMYYMFNKCAKLTALDLSSFDTSKVTNMINMFDQCSDLKSLNLSNFDTSNVTSMYCMFRWCSSLTDLDVSGFNTSKVTNMGYMFYDCESLTSLDVSRFDTSKVTTMNGMFAFCRGLTGLDLRNFITSQVTDMRIMFGACSGLLSLDVSSFDTSNVTMMDGMFRECESLTSLDLSNFDTSLITSTSAMFVYCESLISLDVSSFDTTNVTIMHSMFQACYSLTSLNVQNFDTSNVEDMTSLFNGCKQLRSLDVSNFNTAKAVDMGGMFYECSSLTNLDTSNFDTSNVIYMNHMFAGCGELTDLNLSNFDTSNVVTMESMFESCYKLTELNVSGFNTSKVTDMSRMFMSCNGLTGLDVSGFDTSSVTTTARMFEGCSGLTSLDVSGFNTSKVTDMSRMFTSCNGLTGLDVSRFDTSNVEWMSSMFSACINLSSLDLSNFDMTNVTWAPDMLPSGEKFTLIYTPRNLTQDIDLPDGYGTGIWYKADGTHIKQLPKNLGYSIALQRDKAPTPSSTIIVNKKKTVYVCGEELNIDDITVSFCSSDGTVKTVTDFTTNASEIDMSVPGRKILKVTYNGITVEIVLSVNLVLTDSAVTITLPDRTYIYFRQPITPEPTVTVTVGGSQITLSEGRDYRVSYSNNVNAGDAARIIITGQGYYSGTFTRTFTIDKAPLTITASDITLVAGDAMPDTDVFEYQVQGICRGDSLIRKPSFTCDVVDMTKTGTYTITPHDADAGTNYEITYHDGTLTVVKNGVYHTVYFDLLGRGDNITRRGIKAGSLLQEPSEPQDPETAGYSFAGWYKDKSFAAKQKWNFATDTVQEDMTLYACWLNMAVENGRGTSLCIQDILSQTYTGSAIKPTVLVYDSDGITLLKAGKDYTISYHNNTDADTQKFGDSPIPKGGTGTLLDDGSVDISAGFRESLAYVVIKGKGNYSGTVYQNFHIDRASISDGDGTAPGITLKYSDSLVYTEKKSQKPFSSIKYKKSMTAGKDYTITLSAEPGEAYSAKTTDGAGVPLQGKWQQTNDGRTLPAIPQGYFGTFKMTIEGIGNYSGTVEKTVYVAADKNHLMKNAKVTLGKNQKMRTNVTKEELEKGITLTPAYYDATNKMYYLLGESGDPTGDPIEKADDLFTVKSGSSYLKCGKDYDYTVRYENNHAIGTATMIITGNPKKGYYGSKSVTFKITGTPFKNIIVEGLTDMSFTGKALIQNDVVLTNGKEKTDAEYKEFVYGSDYLITYKNNIKKGTATMTFTALPQSGYSGSFKKTFKIIAADLNRMTSASAAEAGDSLRYGQDDYILGGTVYYTKSGAKISDRIRLNHKDYPEIILKEGVDYTVSYTNNKAVTTGPDAVMTIRGKGNYQGTLTVKFPISAAPMSAANKNLTISAASVFYDGKKTNYEPKVKVTDGNKTLSAGENKDYEVTEYKNTDQAAIEEYLRLMRVGAAVSDNKKPRAVINGRNNYNGSYTLYLDIYETKINSSNLYIVVSNDSGQTTYNGNQLMPEVAVYYGENAKVQAARLAGERNDSTLTGTGYDLIRLAAGSDYTLIWGSNMTAGKNKGSVTVVGMGLYGGKVTGKFTILNKDIYSLN